MRILIEVDSKDWEAALDRILLKVREASKDASRESAELIRDAARAKLALFEHAAETRTPSPPGSPPAMISGTLAASVEVRMEDEWALVGPTGSAASKRGPYGRFLEMGGVHEASNPSGYMKWYEDGQYFSARVLRKGARPYLKPATDEAIDSGQVTRIYADHWARAIAEAT